jgi:hypothetical protein
MPQPPEIRITHGNPTPDEEAAVRAAILRLWRDDQARAARDAGVNAWVASGRAVANGRAAVGRGAKAWRLSGRIGAEAVTAEQTGRGDAK